MNNDCDRVSSIEYRDLKIVDLNLITDRLLSARVLCSCVVVDETTTVESRYKVGRKRGFE